MYQPANQDSIYFRLGHTKIANGKQASLQNPQGNVFCAGNNNGDNLRILEASVYIANNMIYMASGQVYKVRLLLVGSTTVLFLMDVLKG